ncbi:M15 family metallopeptidase [Halomonas sp. AOP35-4E-18]|uniref:M15 family metallopeptidase n=1 Tax=Halomonas sp. AOP35-4E-18 TaxID=3457686 RepID=UPI0040336DC4
MSHSCVIDSEGLEQFDLSDSSIRFGHLRYQEMATENLVCLNDDIWLHKHAAYAFLGMSNAMHRDGVAPVIIRNGYRSYKRQARTFEYYRVKKELGTVKTLTRVALPGHSEHHTGFAVDIRLPKQAANGRLSRSDSYKWLKSHAHKYGFSESYKKNNIFGVIFEPWHWCFNGCAESRALFSTRSLLLKNIDPSNKTLLDIICSNEPMKDYADELFQKFPKIYSALLTH